MKIYNLFPLVAGKMPLWIDKLDYIKSLGFNVVYINPIFQTGYNRNIYAPKNFYKFCEEFIDPFSTGGTEQFKNFIDTCHSKGIKVIYELIFTHTSIDSDLLVEHPEWYIMEDGSLKKYTIKAQNSWIEWGDLLELNNNSDNPEIKNFSGGPMYYIKNGMGSKWKWLGFLFALFGALACFGTGCSVQANSISQVMKSNFGIPTFVTGIILAILTYFVVIGGIKRIGEVTEKLVPFMAIGYIIGTLAIIFVNYTEVLPAFKLIVVSAFKGHAVIGGFAGATVQQAIRYGIARGVFSNEAGLGTAAIAHASAVVRRPGEQGIIGILGGFLDTIIICSMTAFAILVTSGWTSGKTGADLTVYAFNQGLSGFGGYVVVFGLLFFAFSTIIGWCYYGEKCF